MNRRIPRLVVVLLAVLGLAVLGAPAASASERATYLALGDSVPFGFRGNLPPQDYLDPGAFVGYPQLVAHDEHLNLLDASCPGETSGSFISTAAPSNGCATDIGTGLRGYGPGGVFPLHVSYAGSQLDYARHVLETDSSVRLVSLMLGANDGFRCQAVTPPCTSPSAILGLVQQVARNLTVILRELRGTGYRGPILAVTYYSLNYADRTQTTEALALDGAITAASLPQGARIASGFLAFLVPSLRAGGSPVDAGLVFAGDVHPTPAGQELLARAVEQALPR